MKEFEWETQIKKETCFSYEIKIDFNVFGDFIALNFYVSHDCLTLIKFKSIPVTLVTVQIMKCNCVAKLLSLSLLLGPSFACCTLVIGPRLDLENCNLKILCSLHISEALQLIKYLIMSTISFVLVLFPCRKSPHRCPHRCPRRYHRQRFL